MSKEDAAAKKVFGSMPAADSDIAMNSKK